MFDFRKDFNYEYFKNEFNSGDLSGLEYLNKTIIRNCKEYLKEHYNFLHYVKEEYIIYLFDAVMSLNTCNHIYETDGTYAQADNFKYDLYFETRNLLFKELGFDLKDLCN